MSAIERASIVLAGVAVATLTGTLAHAAITTEAPRLDLFLGLAPSLAVVALAVNVLPERWFARGQLAGMIVLWLGWRLAQWPTGEGLVSVLATLGALGLAFLPDRLGWRRLQVLLATGAIGALFLVKSDWERPLVGAALQLVAVAGSRARPTGLADRARCFFATNVTQSTPIPYDEAQKSDRSLDTLYRGALWLALAAPAHVLGRAIVDSPWSEPILSLDRGQYLLATGEALWLWLGVMLDVAGIIFLDAGALRLLGVKVEAPVLEPWKSRDMLDYWRRANTWRYRMMVEGYQRLFMPVSGPLMPVGVFVVFLVSGVHHASTVVLDFFPFLRWTIEGLLCALNAAWNQWKQGRDVRGYLATGARPLRRGLAGAAVLVILAHGLLQNVSRPEQATRDVIREWTSR